VRTYEGRRTEFGCVVTVDGQPLDPRLDLVSHCPQGFEWGYARGTGSAQLALAIVVDHCHHVVADLYRHPGGGMSVDGLPLTRRAALQAVEDTAVKGHLMFKAMVTSRLPLDHWIMTAADVSKVLCRIGEATIGEGGRPTTAHGVLAVMAEGTAPPSSEEPS